MDFLEEYTEFTQLPVHIGVTYKFFSLFKLQGTQLQWCSYSADLGEAAGAAKAFLKKQRADLKEGISKSECSRRMWFWVQKLLELKVESPALLKWLEVCELVLS